MVILVTLDELGRPYPRIEVRLSEVCRVVELTFKEDFS